MVENHAVDIWQLCLWIVLLWGVWFLANGERLWFEAAGDLLGKNPLLFILPRAGFPLVCVLLAQPLVQDSPWAVVIPVGIAAVCGTVLWNRNRKTLVALAGGTAFVANLTKIMDSGAFAHLSRLLSGGYRG